MTTTARTFDALDVAIAVARLNDIDTVAAIAGVETYLAQMEEADGRAIDRDAINEHDVDFLMEAYRQGLAAQGL